MTQQDDVLYRSINEHCCYCTPAVVDTGQSSCSDTDVVQELKVSRFRSRVFSYVIGLIRHACNR